MYSAVNDTPVQRAGYNRHILRPVRHTGNIDIPVKNRFPSRLLCLLFVRFWIVPNMNIPQILPVTPGNFPIQLSLSLGFLLKAGYKYLFDTDISALFKHCVKNVRG